MNSYHRYQGVFCVLFTGVAIQSQDTILRVCNKKFIYQVPGWSCLLVKHLCFVFSGLNIGNYRGLIWRAFWGEAAHPMPDLVPSQCVVVSEGRGWIKDLGTFGRSCCSHICIPSLGASIPRSLYLNLEEILKTLFPTLIPSPSASFPWPWSS